MQKGIYLNNEVQKDNLNVESRLVKLESITGLKSRKGLEMALISENKIVNIVSKSYAHFDNKDFFGEIEMKLKEENINYQVRSTNRDDCRFSAEFLLKDESFKIITKKDDEIVPMLSFTNSYDGSMSTTGHIGLFRKVCSNGLHIAETKIDFKIKHTVGNKDLILPNINEIVAKFQKNEMFELVRKVNVLQSSTINNIDSYIKHIATKSRLFKYEKSEKNEAPSLIAELAKSIVEREMEEFNENANKWHVYNAFNEIIHAKMKNNFTKQQQQDNNIFNLVLSN